MTRLFTWANPVLSSADVFIKNAEDDQYIEIRYFDNTKHRQVYVRKLYLKEIKSND